MTNNAIFNSSSTQIQLKFGEEGVLFSQRITICYYYNYYILYIIKCKIKA